METRKAIKELKRQAMKNFDEVEKAIAAVKESKPAGYDSHSKKMQDYFEGNQNSYVSSLLHQHFPSSARHMTPAVLNIVKKTAEFEASVYRQNPTRELISEKTNEKEQVAFKNLLKKWRLDSMMHELEKRLMSNKTMFCRLNWPSSLALELNRQSLPEITLFYPHKIHVVSDPRAPDDIQAAHSIIIDISTKKEKIYEIWNRTKSGIDFSIIGEETNIAPQKWLGNIMPFVVFHDGLSQESMYLDIDRDAADTQESINLELTDRNWRVRYNSHKMIIQKGGNPTKFKMKVGPNTISYVDQQTDVQVLDLTTNDTSLAEIETVLTLNGLSKRQPSDMWSSKGNAPTQGISRVIANIGSTEKRHERVKTYKRIEEQFLLPLLVDISNVFGDEDSIVNPEFEVIFKPAKVYEDPIAIVNKLAVEQDKGWISPARAATEAGRYRTISDAVKAGVSDEIKMVEGKGTGTMSFGGI